MGTLLPGTSFTGQFEVRAVSAGSATNRAEVIWSDSAGAKTKLTSVTTMINLSLRAAQTSREFTFRSTLLAGAGDGDMRGQIVVNQTMIQETGNAGTHTHHGTNVEGDNRIEARVHPGSWAEGVWRFDFSATHGFISGSIDVDSGSIISLNPRSVTFSIAPNGSPVGFTFETLGSQP